MATQNPNWTRDELILALDVYFAEDFVNNPGTIRPGLINLSTFLKSLPIHPNRAADARFRNPNNVYMKLCNYLRLDDRYSGKGLAAGSQLD